MSPSITCAYGSSNNLAALNRTPCSGSHGPYTRYPYLWPARTPAKYPCQIGPLRWAMAKRVSTIAPLTSLNRHSSIASAALLQIAKLVPASVTVEPRVRGSAGSTALSCR